MAGDEGAERTTLSSDLIAAYLATDYRVRLGDGELLIQIGQLNPRLATLLESGGRPPTGAFLTAWNPEGEACSAVTNAARQRALEERLHAIGAPCLTGYGQGRDGLWPAEESVLAVGLTLDQAVELAQDFRQNAFVWIPGPHTKAELVLLK